MDRREFLVRATIGGVTVPLLVRQLGCSDDDSPGPGPGNDTESFNSLEAQGHTHSITIPDDHLTAGTQQSYTSSSVGHTHTVTISPADFTTLSRGCRVTTLSSESSGHQHVWEIRYASEVSDITTESTADATGHSHNVIVVAGDINTAPSTRNYESTETNLHRHTVVLSQADFETLQTCGIVTVVSEAGGTPSHNHSFSITPAP